MRFMDWIIEELADARDFFYDAYQEVRDWIWPFDLLRYPLYGLYGVFMWLVKDFEDFREWLEWAADWIDEILSWSNIRSLIRSWLPYLEDAVDWFRGWAHYVIQEVTDWWAATSSTVLGWINIATEGFDDLVAAWDSFWHITWPELLGNVHTLSETWDNFWTVIFPDLVSFTWLGAWWDARLFDIQSLIESWTVTLSPFWEGWQDVRDKVLEFFNDPLEWLWVRFSDWFLGPEE